MTTFNLNSNNGNEDEELLEASAACEFLTELWGLEEPYSLVAFRSLRFRYGIKPALAAKRATFWKKSQLRNIPRPDKGKPRPSRRGARKKPDEEGNAATVIRMAEDSPRRRHVHRHVSRPGRALSGVGV